MEGNDAPYDDNGGDAVNDDDGVVVVLDDDDGDNAAPTPKIDNKQYNLMLNNGGE